MGTCCIARGARLRAPWIFFWPRSCRYLWIPTVCLRRLHTSPLVLTKVPKASAIIPFHTGEFWGPAGWSDLLVGGKGRLWIQVILLQSWSCFYATCCFLSKKRKIWQPRIQVMGIGPGFEWAGWSRKWHAVSALRIAKDDYFHWIGSPNILNFTLGHLAAAENLVERGASTLFTTKLWSYRSISGGASCSALCAQVWERSPELSEQLWLQRPPVTVKPWGPGSSHLGMSLPET